MALSKKTTVLFSRDLHDRLSRLAAQKGTSLGDLVRTACERQYRPASREEKLAAVRHLAALRLPAASPRKMKQQAVPSPEEIVP